MDGLSVAKIRTSLVQCLRGYSVNGFGLQRKKDAGGPYSIAVLFFSRFLISVMKEIIIRHLMLTFPK